MEHMPVSLSKRDDARAIEIVWSDGHTQHLSARQLRDHCPCATCREKSTAKRPQGSAGLKSLTILSEADLRPLTVTGMTPAGNYAYNIGFSDGHRSGVYTLDYIRQLPSPSSAGAGGTGPLAS
jgi:DUF971 family protein